MSHIFAGELAKIDPEVLDALKELSDDFWIFAEFNVGRNIDWFFVRPKEHEPATLILTELKRSTRPVRGSTDGFWERQAENGEWEELPANGKDMNFYWQTVNGANALADWLWNFQRLYLDSAEVLPADQFRVWPNLLLLSPHGVQHRLPLGPTNKYGRWFYDIPSWLQHITAWNSRMGISLSPHDVANLADALQLERIWGPNHPTSEPQTLVQQAPKYFAEDTAEYTGAAVSGEPARFLRGYINSSSASHALRHASVFIQSPTQARPRIGNRNNGCVARVVARHGSFDSDWPRRFTLRGGHAANILRRNSGRRNWDRGSGGGLSRADRRR